MRGQIVALFLGLALAAGAVPGQDEPLGRPLGWSSNAETLVRVPLGAELRSAPAEDSEIVLRLPEASVPVLDSQGTWIRTRWQGAEGMDERWVEGWVDMAAPVTVLEVAGVGMMGTANDFALPAGEGWLERRLMLPTEGAEDDDGVPMLFEGEVDEVVHLTVEQALRVAPAGFGQLYGVRQDVPLPPIALVVCTERATFESLIGDWMAHLDGSAPTPGQRSAFATPGRIAILIDRSMNPRDLRRDVAALVLHEVGHHLSWTHFGIGALPLWLEEGVADTLALSVVLERGELAVDPEQAWSADGARRRVRRLSPLRRGARRRLASIVPWRLGAAEFEADARAAYISTGHFVSWLLEEHAEALRRTLAEAGESPDIEGDLQRATGLDEERLMAEFGRWLEARGRALDHFRR